MMNRKMKLAFSILLCGAALFGAGDADAAVLGAGDVSPSWLYKAEASISRDDFDTDEEYHAALVRYCRVLAILYGYGYHHPGPPRMGPPGRVGPAPRVSPPPRVTPPPRVSPPPRANPAPRVGGAPGAGNPPRMGGAPRGPGGFGGRGPGPRR